MAGYSGTPLWKKLGIAPGVRACVISPPPDYGALIEGAPEAAWSGLGQGTGFLHVFTRHRAEVEDVLARALPLIARDGMVWVSWPKKSAKVPTDITEDVLREVALPMGYVDVKVCAVDAVWSGLKFVIRKELR
jgi:hypothetical protein